MKIAFFSDIHANLPALEAFFKDIESVNPDAIYCLGDLVGYNVWPNEVVNEIRKRRIPTIMGNHDEALLNTIQPNDNSNRGITKRILTSENRTYLTQLPRHIQLKFGAEENQYQALLVHGSPKSINDYLTEDYDENVILEWMEIYNAQLIFCGHTHIPYHRIIKTKQGYNHVVNIGSIGKPKDGNPDLCYALVNIENDFSEKNPNSIKVEFRRASYEIETAVNAILNSAFPNEYAQMLIDAK